MGTPGECLPALLLRLAALRDIDMVCLDLAQAGKLGQGTPPTAEWILDNEYVIESNARDIQENLPVPFMRHGEVLLDVARVALYDVLVVGDPLCRGWRSLPQLARLGKIQADHMNIAQGGPAAAGSSAR